MKVALPGRRFRIIVLQAHGKTIVSYVESIYADRKRFPPATLFSTFLPYAQKMLAAIAFP